jgi:hypothetical protein
MEQPTIDQTYNDYRAGRITREYAVACIRRIVDVTEYGARNILDSETLPSGRYARTTRV